MQWHSSRVAMVLSSVSEQEYKMLKKTFQADKRPSNRKMAITCFYLPVARHRAVSVCRCVGPTQFGDCECALRTRPRLSPVLAKRGACRKEHAVHSRIWEVYQATNFRMFDRRIQSFQKLFQGQSWSSVGTEMVPKLWKRPRQYHLAYKHPAC